MIKSLKVQIKNDINELLPTLEKTDESYELKILNDSGEILVTANLYVGLVRGLATVN